MVKKARKITTIQIDQDAKDDLNNIGKKGETYNDIIIRLIKKSRWLEKEKAGDK